jgi:hypothetical protein
MRLFVTLVVVLVVGCSGMGVKPLPGPEEIVPPYKNLGRFVAKDGTVSQNGLWEEVERQNREYAKKCAEESLRSERELLWKNCSAWSGIFWAIKEYYLDKREEEKK